MTTTKTRTSWLVIAADPDALLSTRQGCNECGRQLSAGEPVEVRRDAVWTVPAVLCPPCRDVVSNRAGHTMRRMVQAWREARSALGEGR